MNPVRCLVMRDTSGDVFSVKYLYKIGTFSGSLESVFTPRMVELEVTTFSFFDNKFIIITASIAIVQLAEISILFLF